jgi:hypothetical protein
MHEPASNFRVEIFEKKQPGQKGDLGGLFSELALLSGLILLEYFYTKISFSTPALTALLRLAGQISKIRNISLIRIPMRIPGTKFSTKFSTCL